MIVLASKFVLFPLTTKGFYKANQFNINKTGQLKNNVFIIKCIHLTEKKSTFTLTKAVSKIHLKPTRILPKISWEVQFTISMFKG